MFEKKINKNSSTNNELINQMDQKNNFVEEKKIDNSHTRTSDSSQTIKNEININDINLNSAKDNCNITLNKDELYKTFLLFQTFLSSTQSLNNEKNIENDIINNSNFISALNNFNQISGIEENNSNNIDNEPKEISKFNIDTDNTDNTEKQFLTQNVSSNCQQYIRNSVNKIKKQPEQYINLTIQKINDNILDSNINFKNINISDKEDSNKNNSPKMFDKINLSSNKDILIQENLDEFNDQNFNNINNINIIKKKKINNINESFIQTKQASSNDYSFDYLNNNNDYSISPGDCLKIMSNDLLADNKKHKRKIKMNSIKNKNHNKTSESNEINKIITNINNVNNDIIKTSRERNKHNSIKSYNSKGEELTKNIKKIKVMKNNKDENFNNNSIKNKEQIIEGKIKELNIETIKFREETKKVIKIKKEYEQLHEKLIKDIDNFNKRKDEFEKFRLVELNKINEEKKNLDLQSNIIINNLKLENHSLIISNKKDKEMINHLREYINQLKSLIKKKDEEIKLLSKNSNINNYIINSYRTVGISKDDKKVKYNKFDNKNITFRNSTNPFIEKEETKYITNVSCSKTKNNEEYNDNINVNKINKNVNKKDKSNSFINNINDYSKIEKKKGRNNNTIKDNDKDYKFNSFSENFYSKNNNFINKKIKLDLNAKKIYKEKQVKNYAHRKLSSSNNINIKNIKNDISRNNNNNNSKILNCKPYIKIKDFSKTSTNFYKQKNKIDDINNDTLLEDNSTIKNIDIIDVKMNLNKDYKDYQNELNKPLDKNEYDFIIPEKYINNNYEIIKKEKIDDKEISIYSNNKKEIKFPSGLIKEIYKDGFELLFYNNGDIKQNYPDGKSVYFFKDSNTVQTSYLNGIQIFKFENGQIEKHFPNGFKKIYFPNGKIDYMFEEKKEK